MIAKCGTYVWRMHFYVLIGHNGKAWEYLLPFPVVILPIRKLNWALPMWFNLMLTIFPSYFTHMTMPSTYMPPLIGYHQKLDRKLAFNNLHYSFRAQKDVLYIKLNTVNAAWTKGIAQHHFLWCIPLSALNCSLWEHWAWIKASCYLNILVTDVAPMLPLPMGVCALQQARFPNRALCMSVSSPHICAFITDRPHCIFNDYYRTDECCDVLKLKTSTWMTKTRQRCL